MALTQQQIQQVETVLRNSLRHKFQNYNPKDIKLTINKFKASQGTEYFLSYTSNDEHILYGYLRLRFNNTNNFWVFQ